MKFEKRLARAALGLLLALLVATAVRAQAPVPASPYQALVPVTQQVPAEFTRAAGVGLAEVLVRISGRSDIAGAPRISQAMAEADRYVEQFRYDRAEDGSLLLNLQFAPRTIGELLRGSGVVQAGGPNTDTAVLRVEGVERFEDYAQLLNYLSRLGSKPQPTLVQGGAVTLSLRPVGGVQLLLRQLAEEQRLMAVPVTVVAGETPAIHIYRWRSGG